MEKILYCTRTRTGIPLACGALMLSYAAGSPVLPDVLADSCCFDTHKKAPYKKLNLTETLMNLVFGEQVLNFNP
jgi:hypothetical protein